MYKICIYMTILYEDDIMNDINNFEFFFKRGWSRRFWKLINKIHGVTLIHMKNMWTYRKGIHS